MFSWSVESLQQKKLPTFPPDFLYDNQPIEPACFYELVGENKTKTIDLSHAACQKNTTEFDVKQISYGLLGYNLFNDSPAMSLPYIYYRFIGLRDPKIPDEYYIELHWSGGGAGNFKELILVQKNQSKLKLLKTIAAGDRCFSGVSQVDYTNQILKYTQNVTPAELGRIMGLSEVEIEQLALSDCAVCCIGLAHSKQEEWVDFRFNPFDEKDLEGLVGPCFGQVILPEMVAAQKSLSLESLKVLAGKVRQQCLR